MQRETKRTASGRRADHKPRRVARRTSQGPRRAAPRGGRRLSRAERRAYWQGLLEEWAGSGLTQAAFCRQRGLSAVTLSWWKRRLGFRAGPTRCRPSGAFVEVRPVPGDGPGGEVLGSADNGPTAYEIVLSGGRVLRVRGDFDPAAVSRLVTAVESAC